MELYAILRRGGWRSGAKLEAAAARPTEVGSGVMSDDTRWIRRHAPPADLRVDEIVPIADTVIVRPDPEPAVHS